MADNGNESRMLSGWKSITFGFGVVGLFGAGLMIITGQIGLVLDCVIGALALMLLSAVLEWMGEVEHHLRQIAADDARCVDRLNMVASRVDAILDKIGPGEQDSRGGSPETAVETTQEEAPNPSGPKMYDPKAVADLYRRSQHKGDA